eukprot:GILJ01013987.1.p1 GENE.GILJ01013987.1~~GILJ01013987.1.p1  ORF type:complete len:754 (+),score=122.07 GILJ01013987.1:365-2626(+)
MKGTDFSYQFAVFGFDDGNYAGCKNLVGEKFQCRLFSRPQNLTGYGTVGVSGLLEYTYFRSNYSVSKINAATINYDPRTRSWYNMVDHIPKAMKWSSVYLSAIPTLPIIDVNAAMYNATGALLGVISMTFELGLLSNFLSELVTTTNTVSMLIDNEDLLLASSYSDPYLTSVDIPKPYTGTVPSNCLVSDSANDATLSIMLCRAHISTYSYTPLRELTSKRTTLVKNGQSGALRIKLDSMDYFVSVVPVETAEAEGMHWRFALFVPQNDIVGGIVRGRDIAIYISIAIVVVAVGLCFVILTLLLRPLGELRDQVSKVASLETQPTHGKGQGQVSRSIISEINQLQDSVDQLSNAMVSFTRFIPKEVVRDMLEAGRGVAELGMEPMNVCVLFSDIEKFTTICESVTPEDLSRLLKVYFSRCVSVLVRHNATVDKFIGDAIMAFWGAPIPNEHSEIWACLAALHMQSEIEHHVQQEFALFGQQLRTRTGIHCGTALIGNIGSVDRISYTALGDTVNVASRLEGCNKIFGSSILISSDTREFISDKNFLVRFLGKIKVIGREAPLPVYEVHAVTSNVVDGAHLLSDAEVKSRQSSNVPKRAQSVHSRSSFAGASATVSMSRTAYSNDYVSKSRKKRGAFTTIEEALTYVSRVQRNLTALERSAIRTYNEAMTEYQQNHLSDAFKSFNACREILNTIAPHVSHYSYSDSSEAMTSKYSRSSKVIADPTAVVNLEFVNRMIASCAAGEWAETVQQMDK